MWIRHMQTNICNKYNQSNVFVISRHSTFMQQSTNECYIMYIVVYLIFYESYKICHAITFTV
jgi:hypothetical protein